MRTNLIKVFLFLSLTGCGMAHNMCDHNQDNMTMFCHDVIGYNTPKTTEDNILNRIVSLERTVEQLHINLQSLVEYGQRLSDEIKGHTDNFEQLALNISMTESEVRDLETRIAELETNNRVVGVFDPCGDSILDFDEVIFKMSDGSFIAYFENGNRRYLSILHDGVFQTTDGSHCTFRITNNGTQIND